MSDQREEWGPWIEHDGNGYPQSVIGHYVEGECAENWDHSRIVWRGASIVTGRFAATSWHWGKNGFTDVIRYRIRKPRGLSILEQIARDVEAPAPVMTPTNPHSRTAAGLPSSQPSDGQRDPVSSILRAARVLPVFGAVSSLGAGQLRGPVTGRPAPFMSEGA